MYHEINRHLDSGKTIEIKIQALEKGSFKVDILLIENVNNALRTLFTRDNINLFSSIITIFVGLFELQRFLKGHKAQKTETKNDMTTVTNDKNECISVPNITYNIYTNNESIKDYIAQNFNALYNDRSITAFEILDTKERSLIKIDRSEFERLAVKQEEIINYEHTITEIAKLNIIRASFDHKLKWDFYYKGYKISAKINDPEFVSLIESGEKFKKGDVLEVELCIKQVWDSSVNTFVNSSFKINKIYRHLSPPENLSIEFKS